MKLISAAVAAIALFFSMMLVPTAATAAPGAYPGSVPTSCGFSVPALDGPHRLRVHMNVTAGNAVPTGTIALRLRRHTASGWKLVRSPAMTYQGGRVTFRFGHLRRGLYKVRYFYNSPTNSVFQDCASVAKRARVHG
jgi:hypothetical protein